MQHQGKRVSVVLRVISVLVVAASLSALASCAPADTGLKTLYGSWNVAVVARAQPPFPALLTFNADGGLLGDPPPIGTETTSHGNWERTSATSAKYTFVALISNEERVVVAFLKVIGTLSYDSGSNSWSGPWELTVSTADGTVLGSDGGTFNLTRVAIEALP